MTDEKKTFTSEELLEHVKAQGIELSDEQLEQVSGGWGGEDGCPQGGDHEWEYAYADIVGHQTLSVYRCKKCGKETC